MRPSKLFQTRLVIVQLVAENIVMLMLMVMVMEIRTEFAEIVVSFQRLALVQLIILLVALMLWIQINAGLAKVMQDF
jgi:hypothetical protein